MLAGLSRHAAEHVEEGLRQLGEGFDEEAFLAGAAGCLDGGSFVFLYVGRDLDERTRRIMTFLAEGARMTFFAVEVDHFHSGDADTSVLVPRTAFVPSWITAPAGIDRAGPSPTLEAASVETGELAALMDALAQELGLALTPRRTGSSTSHESWSPLITRVAESASSRPGAAWR